MKAFTILFLWLISSTAMAGWNFTGKVESVQTHANGRVVIVIDQDTSSTSCKSSQFTVPNGDAGAPQALSIAMAAQISDREVSIIWDGSGDNCDSFGNFHTIYRIILL